VGEVLAMLGLTRSRKGLARSRRRQHRNAVWRSGRGEWWLEEKLNQDNTGVLLCMDHRCRYS
jgi:pSer/pThr/pTyr-binding forkhead associated (FHA) protein